MSERTKVVVFRLDEHRYALSIDNVERIVRAVEVTPLPGSPEIVLGAISVAGRILPVLDMRRRFGLPQREITPADHFLIGRTAQRTVVLAIDQADGVIDTDPGTVTASADIVPSLAHVQGVARLDDGLALIHDLDTFLSSDEAFSLDAAMVQAQRC